MERLWLIFAALSGLLGVALGAYGAHGLSAPPERLDIYRTAVAFQMWHALALLGVSIMRARVPSVILDVAGLLFLTGILLFTGSLYAIGMTGSAPLPLVAPIGGLALMAGWATLAAFALKWR
jgi:uncharacterized membrane protein YgdD (TMEM256/DUF423 family)